MVAAQALSAACAAAEDYAPTPALSGSLCIQLATSLHTYVSDVMLAAPDDAEGPTHSSILQVNTVRGHGQRWVCVGLAGGCHRSVAGAIFCFSACPLPAALKASSVTRCMQALPDTLSTAFELLVKAKARHTEQQQAATDGGAGAVATTATATLQGKGTAPPALIQQLLQLESRVLLDMAYCHLNFGHEPKACLRYASDPHNSTVPAAVLLSFTRMHDVLQVLCIR